MKYFIDTEFMEDGRTIDLLSLGIVCEDGREFYAVNRDADHSKANDFVKEKVLPHLFDDVHIPGAPLIESYHATREVIKRAVFAFVSFPLPSGVKPEFWGYYADYDWVVFCQLFGTMINLPKGWPMYCNDVKQLCVSLGDPKLPEQGKGEHHALSDARWNKQAYEFLKGLR